MVSSVTCQNLHQFMFVLLLHSIAMFICTLRSLRWTFSTVSLKFHYEITHWLLIFALKPLMCCILQSRLPFLWLACTHITWLMHPQNFTLLWVIVCHHLVTTFQAMVSLVSIVTGLWGEWFRSIPDSNKRFFSLKCSEWLWDPVCRLFNGYGGSFVRCEVDCLPLGLRLGMSGIIPLLPLTAFFVTQEHLYVYFF